jgi:eukaryotic-like serine/threonine-protein kinase
LPQDRAHRPDMDGAPSSGGGGASSQVQSGSLPDIRGGGTYFLGRYRVVDEIGIGGMASVHLARMDGPGGFQKWVAIKKIHSHLVEDESFVQMFLDEARVAARISHPNVATVFDLGKHEDTYWIAMEYLHGEPLREVMRRTEELGTAMPPEIACRVIADAAEGLHAAHELLGKNGEKLGLVHRDVTPHNLFVTYDGVTKVVDFGIAKFSSRMSHTRAGTLKGKLAYMSPEQVHGEGIDRRTDIFALGVVLWELTTGQRLFRMESDLDTLAKVQECNVPRPSTLIRGYPVDLEKIVMKALAKNRGERFRTAREFSRALQSLLMRRGLFIASDEVAGYTQQIFNDRIQKREAHLRWAAEVTQTINVDQLLSKPKIGSPEFTNSEVQSAPPNGGGKPAAPAVGGPPRPAAGMPAGQMPPPGLQMLPMDAKETGPSLSTPRGPASPFGSKAAGRAPPPPRPAAGAPATLPPPNDEPHPSDGDGPTIQGGPLMDEARAARLLAQEPPTLMAIAPEDRPRPRGGGGAHAETIEPEDFEEDQDETIVGNMGGGQSQNAGFPPPGGRNPNAPLPPGPAPAPPRPQRFPVTAALPAQQQLAPVQAYGAPPSFPGEVPYEPMPMSGNGMGMPPGMHDPNDYGQRPMHMDGAYPRQAHPTGPSGEFVPRQQRMAPTVPRLAHDNRTMTAQRLKRRPPMWVVAALSCSIALLIAGVVIAIISTTSNNAPAQARSGTSTNGVGTAPGPFTAARTAFNTVVSTAPVVPPPPTALAPPPGVAPTPTAPPVDPNSAAMGALTVPPPPIAPTVPPGPTSATTAARPTAVPTQTPPTTPTATTATPTVTVKKPTPASPSALGAITVVCMPKCDQIVDNGTALGPGHIFNRPVPAGRHVLILSAPNGAKKTVPVEVKPEQTSEVRMTMDK